MLSSLALAVPPTGRDAARGRRLAVLVAAALGALLAALGGVVGAAPARAESIAYVQGDEVWQSSLDGQVKRRLSGGEGNWRDLAAADGGNVVGVRYEPGKISQYSTFAVWDANGQRIAAGPLPYRRGWFSYAYPLSVDLTADGGTLVYGVSAVSFDYKSGTRSTYATTIANTGGLEPIEVSGQNWPTTVGRQIVGQSGTLASVQAPGSAPYGADFVPWLDVSELPGGPELHRTDVAANGSLAAVELDYADPEPNRIGVVSVAGLGGGVTGAANCLLPASGDAESVTFSADGSRIAWVDADGLKVAGRPSGEGTCSFASPPAVIATGIGTSGTTIASIGGATVPVPGAGGPAGAGSGGKSAGKSGSGSGSGGKSGGGGAVSAPKSAPASALAGKGILIKARVPGKAKVVATGTVPASLLGLHGRRPAVAATGSARPGKAGIVKIRLHATKRAKSRLGALRKATMKVTVVQGKFAKKLRISLR